MRKHIEAWYSRLTRTGKILLAAAIVALVWLLLQLINSIFGIVPTLGELGLGTLSFILNTIAVLLIVFVIMQAVAIVYFMREENEMYREMMTRGRKGGRQMDQVGGRRHPGMMRGGGRSSQPHVFMTGHITVDMINQKYPARWYKRAEKVSDWMDIEEPGVYTLESGNQKYEIIDAVELGAGYLIGTWEGRWIKWKRHIMLNKRTGRPRSFSSLRNAKKQLVKMTS